MARSLKEINRVIEEEKEWLKKHENSANNVRKALTKVNQYCNSFSRLSEGLEMKICDLKNKYDQLNSLDSYQGYASEFINKLHITIVNVTEIKDRIKLQEKKVFDKKVMLEAAKKTADSNVNVVNKSLNSLRFEKIKAEAKEMADSVGGALFG